MIKICYVEAVEKHMFNSDRVRYFKSKSAFCTKIKYFQNIKKKVSFARPAYSTFSEAPERVPIKYEFFRYIVTNRFCE